jgi:hypothetical protein
MPLGRETCMCIRVKFPWGVRRSICGRGWRMRDRAQHLAGVGRSGGWARLQETFYVFFRRDKVRNEKFRGRKIRCEPVCRSFVGYLGAKVRFVTPRHSINATPLPRPPSAMLRTNIPTSPHFDTTHRHRSSRPLPKPRRKQFSSRG